MSNVSAVMESYGKELIKEQFEDENRTHIVIASV